LKTILKSRGISSKFDRYMGILFQFVVQQCEVYLNLVN